MLADFRSGWVNSKYVYYLLTTCLVRHGSQVEYNSEALVPFSQCISVSRRQEQLTTNWMVKIIEICSFTVQEVRIPKSRCQQLCFLLEYLREKLSMPLSQLLVSAGGPRCVSGGGYITPVSAAIFTPPSVSLCPLIL